MPTPQAHRATIGCLAVATSLASAAPLHAQYQPWKIPVHNQYVYDLQIAGISPGPYLENQPASVNYTLTVGSTGGPGALPPPVPGTICGARKGPTCKPIGPLTLGRVIKGSVSTSAVAGKSSVFKIAVTTPKRCVPGRECFGSDEVVEAAVSRPVAARYMLSVERFTVLTPRAYLKDTVLVNLFGRVEGQRSAAPDACFIAAPPRYCAINIPQGDYSRGTFAAMNNDVGPFDLIPEVDPDLTFSYTLMNFGTTYEQRVAQLIFNGISDFTSAGLTAYTGSQGGSSGAWGGLNDFTHKINAIQFGGCDGPVAVDVVSALNRAVAGNVGGTIYARTDATGVWRAKGPRDVEAYEIESQNGCGRSGRYQVYWTIRRTSWLPPAP